jgi:hypothetical protein
MNKDQPVLPISAGYATHWLHQQQWQDIFFEPISAR